MSRKHIGAILLAGGLALFAGCTATSRRAAAGSGQDSVAAGPQDDYSSDAVAARTESHAHYAAAVLLELNDEPDKAAEEFFEAATADIGNEDLVIETSTRLLKLKKTDKAIELLKKAAAPADSSGAILARLGLAYSIAGMRDLAIGANRRAIKKNPENLAGYQYLAQLYLQNNQAEEGIRVLEEAAKRPSADPLYWIDLGETYMLFARAGKMDLVRKPALDAFKRAAAAQPTNPVVLQRLGDGFNFFADTAAAAKIYSQLLERMPRLPGVRERLVELLIRQQDRTNAIVHLRKLATDNPTSAQFNYLLGTLLFEDRQPKEGAEFLGKALRFDSDFEPAYYDLAAAQINLKKAEDALETLAKARRKFPQKFVCEFYTGLAYSQLKDPTNALKSFTAAEVIARAKETNRLTHTFFFQLGSAYERAQNFKEAEVYFRKSLALSPDFAEALNYLGYMWADRGENLKEAREMIEKAVKLDPKNSAFLDSLGWVLYKLEKHQEALRYIQKAIDNNDEPDATLYEHLGDVYSALHKSDQARQAFQKAYSIDPNEQIQRKLNAAPAPRSPE
jgi:tetratricopeptide (TPR) repeat protein